jgi:hypothetical protein
MKRAGRWLFNFAAAVSAGMCAATIVDWMLWGEAKSTFGMARLRHDASTAEFFSRLAVDLVPYWAVVLATLFLPLFWLLSYTLNWHDHRRRYRVGMCGNCGYDLRATPDLCPECGTIPPAAKGAAV